MYLSLDALLQFNKRLCKADKITNIYLTELRGFLRNLVDIDYDSKANNIDDTLTYITVRFNELTYNILRY